MIRSTMLLHSIAAAVVLFEAGGCLALALGSKGSSGPASGAGEEWLRGITTGRTRVVDLSYSINDHLPAWPGDTDPYVAKLNASIEKNGFFTRKFCMLEHYGTHMDAPNHFGGKLSVDAIPVRHLFGPAIVIDVREQGTRNADYRLTTGDVEQWERRHGRVPGGAIVLLRTGWAARWPDAKRYRNEDPPGTMHFPGFSLEAAKLLMLRGAVGFGIDTMSVDYGATKDFPVHNAALKAGLYHLENLADLSGLPETGAFLIAAPIKLDGGSGGACRVFAILP